MVVKDNFRREIEYFSYLCLFYLLLNSKILRNLSLTRPRWTLGIILLLISVRKREKKREKEGEVCMKNFNNYSRIKGVKLFVTLPHEPLCLAVNAIR